MYLPGLVGDERWKKKAQTTTNKALLEGESAGWIKFDFGTCLSVCC